MNSSILTFGPSKNARLWSQKLTEIGIPTLISIMAVEPGGNKMIEFFRTPANWIYFSGHHLSRHLRNYYPEPSTAGFRYYADKVEVYTRGLSKKVLTKGKEFQLHVAKPQVLFWGGCNVCSDRNSIEAIRGLFNNPLILGYADLTGWKITHKLFTGTHLGDDGKPIKRLQGGTNFFDELKKGDINDLEFVRRAWLETARKNYGRERRARVSAVDPNGQVWTPDGEFGEHTYHALPHYEDYFA